MAAALLLGRSMGTVLANRANNVQVIRTSVARANQGIVSSKSARVKVRTTGGNPFERSELLNRLGGRQVRCVHTDQASTSAPTQAEIADALKDEKWVAVYRYPGIRVGVLLARAKLVQTVVSVLFLPYASFQYLLGQAELSWFLWSSFFGVSAPLLLFIFSRYLNRLIGVVAMTESNEFARVGYLTFWGARKNRFYLVSDVMPLSETGASQSDTVCKFSTFDDAHFLYLPTKHVEILDEDRASLLFGDLDVFRGASKKSR